MITCMLKVLHYNEVRRRAALVEFDREHERLRVLLPYETSGDEGLRERLMAIGLRPSASPASRSVSFACAASDHDVDARLRRVHSALGSVGVLSVGACFDPPSVTTCMHGVHGWPGHRLLHVGGTRRCLVFDGNVADSQLDASWRAARLAYESTDFRSATE